MRNYLPWLCQGDVFGNVPVLDVAIDGDINISARMMFGPAVLMTHDCAMDKPDKDGRPRVEFLQFARLRSMASLPEGKRNNLRGARAKVPPFEAMYLGEVAEFGEAFILLTDPYFLPSRYFSLAFVNYRDHVAADPQVSDYITPRSADSRVGRIDEEQIDLLRRKMMAFWTRFQADG